MRHFDVLPAEAPVFDLAEQREIVVLDDELR